MNNYVQLEATMQSIKDSDQRANDLKQKLAEKHQEVMSMVSQF